MVELSAATNVNLGRNLPVLLGARQERQPFYRARVKSDFASQLIAARDQMPVQREHRRAGEEVVLVAYDRTARLTERRMPQGYRLSITA